MSSIFSVHLWSGADDSSSSLSFTRPTVTYNPFFNPILATSLFAYPLLFLLTVGVLHLHGQFPRFHFWLFDREAESKVKCCVRTLWLDTVLVILFAVLVLAILLFFGELPSWLLSSWLAGPSGN